MSFRKFIIHQKEQKMGKKRERKVIKRRSRPRELYLPGTAGDTRWELHRVTAELKGGNVGLDKSLLVLLSPDGGQMSARVSLSVELALMSPN